MSTLEITNEDCMELMARYPDKHFDLAIVDPPYGIGGFSQSVASKPSKWRYDWNYNTPKKEYFIELCRVSVRQVVWGANYYNQFSKEGGALVWYKDTKHPNVSRCEIASVSGQKKVDFYRYDWSNTDKYNELRGADIHPCEKPVTLYEWLLKNYAKEGNKILDTHLGSGSIAIACYNYGFDLTACELDKDYFDAAMKRIQAHTAQTTIFDLGA